LHGNAVADEMALVQLGTCPRLIAVCVTGDCLPSSLRGRPNHCQWFRQQRRLQR